MTREEAEAFVARWWDRYIELAAEHYKDDLPAEAIKGAQTWELMGPHQRALMVDAFEDVLLTGPTALL